MGHLNANLVLLCNHRRSNEQNAKLTAKMSDHEGRKSACGREMGNNEFSWSGLSITSGVMGITAFYLIDFHIYTKLFIKSLKKYFTHREFIIISGTF